MRPSNTSERIPALVPTDNCSVADTSVDDRTLASFVNNAVPTTGLSPPNKRPEKRPSRETSPSIKHKGLPAEVATIENWRPHVSTVTEKSTGSTDSMGDRPPESADVGSNLAPKPNASDRGSLRRRRPGASYGADALASLKARLVAERDTSDISSAAITTHSESGDLALMQPLEPESDMEAANEFYFRSMARLPLLFAPDYGLQKDSKCTPRPSNHPSTQNPSTDFSFAGPPRTPGPSGPQDTHGPLDDHPEVLSLSPTLQSLVRKNLRPEAGEKGRAVAAIILECFSGSKQVDMFELPSKSRLPPYVNVRPRTLRQETESGSEDLEYAKGTDGSFSFSHRTRLPLHMIAGAEVGQMKIKANAMKSRPDNLAPPKTPFGKFEFKQGPSLPSFSTFFKGPIETSTLSTQLARNGVPLQISEAGKKGHIIGSIDSVGEYIRPNADPSFLFSITPFTKSEVQAGKRTKDVLFGKLEKTWRKQDHVEEKTRSNRSTSGTTGTCARNSNLHGERGSASTNRSTSTSYSTQTAPSSIFSEGVGSSAPSALAPPPTRVETTVGTDETLTGDRHRFDALINRLQQKLSERSEQDSKVAPSTKTDVSDSGRKATNISTVETKIDSGPSMDNKILASTPLVTSNTQTLPPTLPPRPKAEPNPYLPSAAVNGGSWRGAFNPRQPPFYPSNIPFFHPTFPEQQTTVQGMAPQPGVWQPHPPQAPASAPAALAPPVPAPAQAPAQPCAGDTLPRWPMSKRPNTNRRQRTPFIPLDASAQQKIEEHIELLKSTIPNFATLSKRRQELRWGKHKGKPNRQRADVSCPWTNPYQPQRQLQFLPPQQVPPVQPVQPTQQLHQMQLQQMQQIQQMQLDQQCHQQGHPVLTAQLMQPMQPMQPYYPYAQYYPNTLGTSTWPMPMMNMTI